MTSLSLAGKLAGNLPGLLLEAEKVAHSFMKGVHGRRRVGTGEAFWQFRPFTQGDSSRDVDWRQSAKREDVFVRQTEWEAAQSVWLWRDASPSMNFASSSAIFSKKDYAEILLLAIGMVLLNGGEQASLLDTDLPPQTGHASIQRIFEMLPAQGNLAEGARPVAAKSHVILFSDFYFPLEELAFFCERLAARNVKGVLVQVFDPSETTLADKGRVRFQDAENDGMMLDIPQVEAIRGEYEQKFSAHRDSLCAMAKGFGWTFVSFSTDTKPEAVITQLYNDLSAQG